MTGQTEETGAEAKEFTMLGLPVGHSISPQVWPEIFAAAGRPSWRYTSHDVEEDELSGWLDRLRRGEVAGAHVTMPYKSLAASRADVRDDTARAAGAASWLQGEDGALVARNTDVEAAASIFAGRRFGRVLLLGSGGAARAVLAALRGHTDDVVVTSLDEPGGEAAAAAASSWFDRVAALPWRVPVPVSDAELIVNATPLGMEEPAPAEVPLAPGAIGPDTCVYDLVYHRDGRTTPLQAMARARGAELTEGWDHLAAQMTATLAHMGLSPALGPTVARLMKTRRGDVNDATKQ
jgi:shikimate dehydrogenase